MENPLVLPLVLRPMVPTDVQEVAAIEAESYDDAWLLDDFVGWFDHKRGLAAVVTDDVGDVAGFVLYERYQKRLHVANVAVGLRFRRRGIALALMHHVAAEARKLGRHRVTLEVRKSNATAIACYLKIGYVQEKVIPAYYLDGEDGLYMQLELD